MNALPEDLRARVHEHQAGDEFTFHGWHRPIVLLPPPQPRGDRTLAVRLLGLLLIAAALTLILVATGAHT